MFANITVQQLVQAIETSNTAFLKKLPGIGPKAAQQIILDLKGKLVLDPDQGSVATAKINPQLQEARDALKSLGFKASEIDNVLSKISVVDASTEEYLKQALKMLGKQKSY
jgi:Holliday junction DNA helicase RuvA